MTQLARTVAVGPRARHGSLPDHVDAFGQLSLDVLVSPDVVEACRALHEPPLALVLTSVEPCQETVTALAAITGWPVSTALVTRD